MVRPRPTSNSSRTRASKRPRRRSHRNGFDPARKLHHETLEKRELLAGDLELVAISPNLGSFINDGTELTERPRELTFQFSPGQSIDPSSLGAIQIVGSGGDNTFADGNEVVISPGFIGLGDSPDQVVFRFAQSLADDRYQIKIIGDGSSPLQNTADPVAPFNDGSDVQLEFDLNLGATVQAVLPQPIVRDENGSISQLRDTIYVYFNDDALDAATAEDIRYYRLIDTSGSLDSGDDSVLLPQSVTYDPAINRAVLQFAADLPDSAFRLRVGTSNESGGSIAEAVEAGTLFNTSQFSYAAYIGDEGVANDVDLFSVRMEAGDSLTISVAPNSTLDAAVRFFDADGISIGGVVDGGAAGASEMVTTGAVPTAGTYFVGVSSEGNEDYLATDGTGATGGSTQGGYQLNLSIGASINGSDDNSSFASATDLGVLGVVGQSFRSQIEPQPILLPLYPGGSDEPGHREIPAESHGAGAGAGLSFPGAIGTVTYHFPDQYGTNPSGLPLFNEITPNQKLRTREIFELYASLYGFEVQETENSGIPIITGDIRAFEPTYPITVSLSVVLISGALDHGSSPYGGGWFNIALHEIGHAIGLGHSYDLPSVQGVPVVSEDQFPSNHDIVHGQRIIRPDSTDIDLYRFDVPEAGTIKAEVVAERLAVSSFLDSALKLYRLEGDGTRTLVAQNDDYFSDDAYIELSVDDGGTYFLGVSSTGNTDYDPTISDTGFGGVSDGAYELKLAFDAAAPPSSIVDQTGIRLDGDADGIQGGTFEFDFRSDNTIFVDKLSITNLRQPLLSGQTIVQVDDASIFSLPVSIQIGDETMTVNDINTANNTLTVTRSSATTHLVKSAVRSTAADGTAALPFGRIQDAIAIANPGDIIRIVANGGADGDVTTELDNRPYVVGFDESFRALEDGSKVEVPQGVLLQVDPGAIIKLQKANLNVGSSAPGDAGNDLSGSAIQILGTPDQRVFLTAYGNDLIGGDSDGVSDGANAGDWGGLVFRQDSDFIPSDASLDALPITLNYVNHAEISFGGGLVSVNGAESSFSPIHMDHSRPTISYNTIRNSSGGALSADPDSFSDAGGRIGPDIVGNTLRSNTTNGVVVRFDDSTGATAARLNETARFDDTDIVHVITDNLEIAGNPGGQTVEDNPNQLLTAGRLAIDPGVVVKLSSARIEGMRGSSNLIAEGTPQNPIIFTSLLDDSYGGSGTFDTSGNGLTQLPGPGDWSGLVFNMLSTGSIDNALISYAGGESPIAGGTSRFNTIEAHHGAKLRLANSTITENANGNAGDDRDGRGTNRAATIFVRQAQPIIVNNIFTKNFGALIDINANAMVAKSQRDTGRSTGALDVGVRGGLTPLRPGIDFADNAGPLVRWNRFDDNTFNGMTVRGGKLTTASIWDDTDIVHVVLDEIIVDHHHTYSGLQLRSSTEESLVVKLRGDDAGFTADGVLLDIEDRIGGTVEVLGRPGVPVVITALSDCTIGAGLTPDGLPHFATDGTCQESVGNAAEPGEWRSLRFNENANDRNVRTILESESANNRGVETNDNPGNAQQLGELAKDLKSGDDNRALGFEVHGYISADDTSDTDLYSFNVDAGTEVWIDLDRTRSAALDAQVELVRLDGTVLARATGNDAASITSPSGLLSGANLGPLTLNDYDGGDFFTLNQNDAGMRVILPGTVGGTNETYYVRVSSEGGLTSGEYQMQVRLRQLDEKPGSTVQYADIRFANNGIEVFGLPSHSPLLAESAEAEGNNNAPTGAQPLGNQLESDRSAIQVGGVLGNNDIDYFQFTSDYATTVFGPSIQAIPGVNAGVKTWSTVFDLDYADGLTRGDTSLVVFQKDSSGNSIPILIGRESNVSSDQPAPGQGIDLDDLLRGSAGQLDPFIGPVQLPTGGPGGNTEYFVGVMSNAQLLEQLNQTFRSVADNPLVRLEPVNSVTRIVEDHIGFQGYESNGSDVDPRFELFDITDTTTLAPSVRQFDLSDVPLFVSSDSSLGNGGQRLQTFDPLYGDLRTDIARLSDNQNFETQDLVMRSDGTLWAYQRVDGFAANNLGDNGTAGRLVQIDPGNGAISVSGNDNILGGTPTRDVSNSNGNNPGFPEITFTDDVDALAWERSGGVGNTAQYALYYSVRENGIDAVGTESNNSKLYRANPDNGSATKNNAATNQYGVAGDIQPAGVTYASRNLVVSDGTDSSVIRIEARAAGVAGNGIEIAVVRSARNNPDVDVTVVGNVITLNIDSDPDATAQEIIDAINEDPQARRLVTAGLVNGTSGRSGGVGGAGLLAGGDDGLGYGPLRGNVTGLAFSQFHGDNSLISNAERLYGVTNAGEFVEIDTGNGTVTNVVDLSSLFLDGDVFQGLALGPQNLHEGLFRETLFAITQQGRLVALDPNMLGVGTIPTDVVVNAFGANNASHFGSDDEIQELVPSGLPVNSVIAITVTDDVYGTVTTDPISIGSGTSVAPILNALLDLETETGIALFQPADLIVTGGSLSAGDSVQIEFQGHYVDKPVNALNVSVLSGSGSVAVTTVAEGGDGVRDAFFIQTSATNPTGLAFSPLDLNLWHPTTNRGSTAEADDGHGINSTFDFSRTPGSVDVDFVDSQDHEYQLNQEQGGISFYFGLEEYVNNNNQEYLNYESGRTQLGALLDDYQRDLTSASTIGDNYNLPGGAYGSLLTDPFDLTSETLDDTSVGDRPTLYFNYFLESEDQNTTTDNATARDTARVYLSNDGGRSWELLATNNTPFAGTGRGTTDADTEVADFVSHLSSADTGNSKQQVQPLFDNTGTWRQARVDLGDYAGQSGLRLRFDFSTAGTIVDLADDGSDPAGIANQTNDADLATPQDQFGNLNDARRGQNNQHEGFYVDDIIIGWAERGEVITGASNNPDAFNTPTDPDPLAPIQALTGPYQLEIRRGQEYAAIIDPIKSDIAISTTFDPNADLVPGGDLGLPPVSDDFSTDDFNALGWRPNDGDAPWTVSDEAATSGPVNVNLRSDLSVTVLTGAGLVTFDHLFAPDPTGDDRFEVYVDASGDAGPAFSSTSATSGFESVSIPVDSGIHTFTFVFRKGATGTDGEGSVSIDNVEFPGFSGGSLRGDRNVEREQGQFLIHGNIIRDVNEDAIHIEAAARDAGTNFAHPGSPIQFETLNSAGLVPGVSIVNNILTRFESDAISIGGEVNGMGDVPAAAVPLAKVANNTIYGGAEAAAGTTGIRVENNATATMLNNLIVNTATGVDVDGTSNSSVLVRTYFRGNTANIAGSVPNSLPIADNSNNQLFVNADGGNFYLAGDTDPTDLIFDGALPIDRSLSKVDDRTIFVSVKDDLGIPSSNVLSPRFDIFGQRRVDDASQPPSGVGSEVFNDVGAIERADFVGPFATLLSPLDNSDIDLNPIDHDALIVEANFLSRLEVQLNDSGIGIDDSFVTADQWELRRGNTLLTEGVDYAFIFDPRADKIVFQATTVFAPENTYTITLIDRTTETGLRDLAGNLIQSNRPTDEVRFEIFVDDGVNSAPVNSVPEASTINEDESLTFSSAGGNAITFTDSDATLGSDQMSVTLVANHGSVTPVTIAGVNQTSSAVIVTGSDKVTLGSAATLIGESVMIDGTAFNFVDETIVTSPGPTDVAVNSADTASEVAIALTAVLNHTTNFGAGAATVSSSDVTLTGITASDASNANIRLGGATLTTPDGPSVIGSRISVGDRVFTYVDANSTVIPTGGEIAIVTGATADDVAVVTATVLNSAFGSGSAMAAANVVTLASVNTISSLVTLTGSLATLQLALDGLTFTPDANYFGPASLTVVTEDNGEFSAVAHSYARDVDTIAINVTDVNDTPTVDDVSDQTMVEDDANLTVNLSGINAGPVNETGPVRIIATSSDVARVPNPVVTYDFFDSTGTLVIDPNDNAFGTVTITVTSEDAGPDGIFDDDTNTTVNEAADNLTTSTSFDVIISGVNDAPLIDAISDQSIPEDNPGGGNVTLTGIADGPGGESGEVVISVTAFTAAGVIANPTVGAISGGSAAVQYDLIADAVGGPASITVTVEDAGTDGILLDDPGTAIDESADNLTTSQSFSITVTNVNDPPVIDNIDDLSAPEESAAITVPLSGIGSGAANESEDVRILSVTSDNQALIADSSLVLTHTTGNSTGSLTLQPTADAFGTATITLTIQDAGVDNDFDTPDDNASSTASFVVTITELNDLPQIDAINPQSIDEDTGPATVALTGINNGSPNEDDAIRVSAVSSDEGIVPNPTVSTVASDGTATLNYDLVGNANGTVTVTVTVEDAGIDNTFDTTDDGVTTTTFDIVVNPTNDAPIFNSIANQIIDEDMGPGIVTLSGIDNGPADETEDVRFFVTSSDTSLISDVSVDYTSLDPTAQLSYTLVPDASGGPVTITVTAEDAGPDGIFDDDVATVIDESADNLSSSDTFLVTVDRVNDPPSVDTIGNQAIDEDSVNQIINVTGIATGASDEIQPISVTATSSDPTLVPHPVVEYTSPDGTATLTINPLANQFGSTTISVRIEDGGFDGNLNTLGDNAVTVETFELTVNEVNDTPTLDQPLDVVILEDDDERSSLLAGISSGPSESQTLSVTAVSSNTDLIAEVSVDYVAGSDMATLRYTPIADQFGTTTVTVRVEDDGLDGDPGTTDDNSFIERSFVISVQGVNDQPTISTITDVTIDEDAGQQTIPIEGITSGAGESDTVRVTATSDNVNLIPHPSIIRSGNSDTGSLQFESAANASGVATITVRVEDAGSDRNFSTTGDNSFVEESFTITVNSLNDAPTLSPLSDLTTTEDAGPQTVQLTGIGTGAANETQSLRVSATSADPTLVGDFVPTYTSAETIGSLSLTPLADQFGTTIVTVTVEDAGDDNDFDTADDNNSFSQTFEITITPIDDVPTLASIAAQTVDEDSGELILPLSGISAGGGEMQDFQVIATSSNPALIPDPTIEHTPPGDTATLRLTPVDDGFGTATITVSVTDGGADGDLSTPADNLTTTQSFTVSVENLPDSPQAVDDSADTDEDTSVRIRVSGLLDNDIDPDLGPGSTEELSIDLSGQLDGQNQFTSTLGATLTYDAASGILTYDPSTSTTIQALKATSPTLQDSFTYAVVDADGETNPPTATVFINISGINDAPRVTDDEAEAPENGEPIVIKPLANDVDVDGGLDLDTLIITDDPQFGSLAKRINELGEVELAYTPFDTFTGNDSFQYTISDDQGQQSARATVTIKPNPAPKTGVDIVGGAVGDGIAVNVLANDTPRNGSFDLSSLTVVTDPTNGTAVVQADGSILYTPNAGYIGTDSFEYTIADTEGNISKPSTVAVNVVRSGRQNPLMFADVNASGRVTSLDALLVINQLATSNGSPIPVDDSERGPNFFDVDGSTAITALDALRVINVIAEEEAAALRQNAFGESVSASGESVQALAPAPGVATVATPWVQIPSQASIAHEQTTKLVDGSIATWSSDDVLDKLAIDQDSIHADEPEDQTLESLADLALRNLI